MAGIVRPLAERSGAALEVAVGVGLGDVVVGAAAEVDAGVVLEDVVVVGAAAEVDAGVVLEDVVLVGAALEVAVGDDAVLVTNFVADRLSIRRPLAVPLPLRCSQSPMAPAADTLLVELSE
jgi:tetrahydrodipicolinate N-succinyltransferase